jgi:hypothetical protein
VVLEFLAKVILVGVVVLTAQLIMLAAVAEALAALVLVQ